MACGGGLPEKSPISIGKSSSEFEALRTDRIHREYVSLTDRSIPGVKYRGVHRHGSDDSEEFAHKFEWTQKGWKLNVTLPRYYPYEQPRIAFVEYIPELPEVNPVSGDVWLEEWDWVPAMNLGDLVAEVVRMVANVEFPSSPEPPRQPRPPISDGVKFPLHLKEFHYMVEKDGDGEKFQKSLKAQCTDPCHFKYLGMGKKYPVKDPHIIISGRPDDVKLVVKLLTQHLVQKGLRRSLPTRTDALANIINQGSAVSKDHGIVAPASAKLLSPQTSSSAPRTTQGAASSTVRALIDDLCGPSTVPTPTPNRTVSNLIDFSSSDSDGENAVTAPQLAPATAPKETPNNGNFNPLSLLDELMTVDVNADPFEFGNGDVDAAYAALMVLASTHLELPDHLKNITWADLSDDQRRNFISCMKPTFKQFPSLQYSLAMGINNIVTKAEKRVADLQLKMLDFLKYTIMVKKTLAQRQARVEEMERKAEKFRCPVCMNRMKDTALSCGDTFCHNCVKCFKYCPLCRRAIEAAWRLYE